MAFTDDFTGTAGQLLSARAGWTFGFGDNTLAVNASGQLAKTATGTATLSVWYRTDDGSIAQYAGADLLFANGVGLFVMGSGADAASFNGYYMRSLNTTAVRVYRINNGTIEASPALTVSSLTNILALELRATVSGGNTVVEVYQSGALKGSYTDSTANKKTSGRRGLLIAQTSAANPAFDNYADNYAPAAAITIDAPAVPFYEGVKQVSVIDVSGTYSGTVASIQARLIDGSGNALSGFDWSTKVGSPSGNTYALTFNGAPAGGPYRVQVRDGAVPGTIVTGTADRYVGVIAIFWGQSQCDKLFSTSPGVGTPTAGLRAFMLRIADETKPGAPAFVNVLATPGAVGSGVIAAANQWMADTSNVPILFVDCNYPGTAIEEWINDATHNGMTWPLWTGLATTMLNAAHNQASAVVYWQGTANAGTSSTYAAAMETLRGKFAALLPNWSPHYAVTPHPRSNDTNQTWNLRNVQYQKAISGDPWRLLCWMLDGQMDGDASPHQLGTATGNIREGTRLGRGLAKLLVNAALDIGGPQIVTADFVDATRMAIDIAFDRDIKTPSGATTGLPGHFVSTNNGGAYAETPVGYTVAIIGARTIRVTSTSAAFPIGATRYDLLRGIPFSSDPTAAAYVGPEASMETDYLSKVLTDTSGFDGGRGMPAAPVMGTGVPVALPITIAPTNASGSVTMRVRQAA